MYWPVGSISSRGEEAELTAPEGMPPEIVEGE